jgi:hypothetical protein
MLVGKKETMKISFVAIVSMILIFAVLEYQPKYADGIASSSTICINGKCVTKVCPENEPCRTIGDNSTSSSNDNSTRDRDNITSSIPLRTI